MDDHNAHVITFDRQQHHEHVRNWLIHRLQKEYEQLFVGCEICCESKFHYPDKSNPIPTCAGCGQVRTDQL
jgi:hypothetical protein